MSGAETILGVVAGGAGLLSLAIQLAENARKLKGFYNDYRGAPDTLQDLAYDLETMSLSMRQLEQHRREDNHNDALLDRCIARCQKSTAKIGEAVEKMNRYTTKSQRMGKAYMVFRERDITKALAELDHARGGLQLAFMMYHAQEQTRQAAAVRELFAAPNSVVTVKCDSESESTRVAAQLRKRAQPELDFSIRLSLPTWMSSKIWHIAMLNAKGGWDVCLRTYNVRPLDTEVFSHCSVGDIPAVRRLVTSGTASLLDADVNGRGLLEQAAHYGHIELCRWLLRQAVWPDREQVLYRSMQNFALELPTGTSIETMVELGFQVFVEEAGLEIDFGMHGSTDDTMQLMQSTLFSKRIPDILIKNSLTPYCSLPLQDRLTLAGMLLERGSHANLAVSDYLANIGLQQPDAELGAGRTSSGESVFHHIAIALWQDLDLLLPCSRQDDARRSEWAEFARQLLAMSTEPIAVITNLGGRSLATPLLHAVLNGDTPVWHISLFLRTWAGILEDSGVDLRAYGQIEQEAWVEWRRQKLTVDAHSAIASFGNNHWRAKHYELVCGDSPEQWRIEFKHAVYCAVYELRQLPGAYPAHMMIPRTIIWPPDSQETDEGHWELTEKGQVLLSTSVSTEPAQPQIFDTRHIWDDLLTSTQDDTAPVMLLDWRSRPSRDEARRSSSQPPTTHRDYPENDEHDGLLVPHSWFPTIHQCVRESKVRFKGAFRAGYVDRACYFGSCRVLDTIFFGRWSNWSEYSFVGDICACQDARRSFRPENRGTLQHNRRPDCPYGCAQVHLHDLNVPESLRPYHPVRRRKWASLPLAFGPARPEQLAEVN